MRPSHANMARRQCSFTLSSEATGLGEAEGPAAAGAERVRAGEGVLEEAGAAAPEPTRKISMARTAQKEGIRLRGEGSDAPGNLSATAVQSSGCRGYPGEPDAGAARRPGAGQTEHGPAAVDDLALGVLVVIEGNDGELAAAGVDAELRVKVRGGGGAELGDLLVIGGGCREQSVSGWRSHHRNPREEIACACARSTRNERVDIAKRDECATSTGSRVSRATRVGDPRASARVPKSPASIDFGSYGILPSRRSGKGRTPWCGAPRRRGRSGRTPWGRRQPW